MKRWWMILVAALAALLASLTRGRSPWKARAQNVAQAGERAQQVAIKERAQQEAQVILDELEAKRGATGAARLASALERARQARAGGDPKP